MPDTHGGFGFVDTDDVERTFRETRVYRVAPVSSAMIRSFVATNVLRLPKSYDGVTRKVVVPSTNPIAMRRSATSRSAMG